MALVWLATMGCLTVRSGASSGLRCDVEVVVEVPEGRLACFFACER